MKLQTRAEEMADLLAVATARIDASGVLLEANRGFLRLLGGHAARTQGTSIAPYFIQPAFAALAAAAPGIDGEAYRGLLTIGDYAGKTRTLLGRVWRTGNELLLLAEVNVEELERITDQVLELNRELTASQHALAQVHLALKQRESLIREASLTDSLTGIGNRRRLEQALAAEISRALRTGNPLSALMADLDNFKAVNDRFGHGAGDKVLTRFAELLRSQTRPTDIVARYGGEEFVVLLPHADLASAAALGERVRCQLQAETIAPLDRPVTASFGAAELRADENGDALLDRADEALYRAKAEGRNKVVAAATGLAPKTPAATA